jgi:hypothetical protein
MYSNTCAELHGGIHQPNLGTKASIAFSLKNCSMTIIMACPDSKVDQLNGGHFHLKLTHRLH